MGAPKHSPLPPLRRGRKKTGSLMEFRFSEDLKAHMIKKRKLFFVIDVATANCSDIEVSEIFFRLADASHADYLVKKKRFRPVPCGEFTVLLPAFRLEYAPVVTLDLRRVWLFQKLSAEGIRL